MPQFRKKPVIIDAIQFDGLEWVDDVLTPMFEGSFSQLPEWLLVAMGQHEAQIGAVFVDEADLKIHTLEGDHTAAPGDFIIRGVKGELYPCKPDNFEATYEPVQ